MTELEKIIANLGYPVGMGMAPSPADLARMKSAIIEKATRDTRPLSDEEIKNVRREAYEECAKEIEKWEHAEEPLSYRDLINRIRALKDKP